MAFNSTSVRGGIDAMHTARTVTGSTAAPGSSMNGGSELSSDVLVSRSGYIVVAG